MSDDLNGSIEVSGGRLVIPVSDLKDDTQTLYDVISYYEYESENGWQFVYDDMRDRGIDEYERENLISFIEKYYEENAPQFRQESYQLFGEKMLAFRTELELISEHN